MLERWSPKLSYFFGLESPGFLIDHFLIKKRVSRYVVPVRNNIFACLIFFAFHKIKVKIRTVWITVLSAFRTCKNTIIRTQ